MGVIARLLVYDVFLGGGVALSKVRLDLFRRRRTVRMGRAFPLFFRVRLLRRLSSLFSNFGHFQVGSTSAICLRFNLVGILFFWDHFNLARVFLHFLLTTVVAANRRRNGWYCWSCLFRMLSHFVYERGCGLVT